MKGVSGTVAIRRMTAEDVDWAKRLAEGSPHAPQWPAAAYLAAVDPDSLPKRVALVAETPKIVPNLSRFEGRIAPRVGFAVASLVPPQSELETIVVAPAARRSGVGATLSRAILEQLKTFGAQEVTLEVRGSNRPAFALYRSLGFNEVGRRKSYYADPVEDAVVMRLELG